MKFRLNFQTSRIILLALLLLACSTITAQEKRYFTSHFQKMTPDHTENVRTYYFQSDSTTLLDHQNDTLNHKIVIRGLSKIEEINEFARYCISLGSTDFFKDYFEDLRAEMLMYDEGKKHTQVSFHGKKVRYMQAWSKDETPLLVNGNGEHIFSENPMEEVYHMAYVDSVLVQSIGIRALRRDTIYYHVTTRAEPKEGMAAYYQQLMSNIVYPRSARRTGKEGTVYVRFVVDKNGKLTELTPLTNHGYEFESRVMKAMLQSPAWKPGMHEGKPVKMKFMLPVTFALRD